MSETSSETGNETGGETGNEVGSEIGTEIGTETGSETSERFQHLRLVEAILFASSEAVAESELAKRLPEGVELAPLLEDLASLYANRGVNLVRRGKGWAFRTAPDLAALLRIERKVTRRLSRAAIETLATIAYHQPVTRAEIEEIRGVALSRGTLDVLLEAGWIRPRGRRRTPGRPVTWGTSESFLDHFGLEALDSLPRVAELRAAGLLDSRPAIAALGARGQLASLEELAEAESAQRAAHPDSEDEEEILDAEAALAATFGESQDTTAAGQSGDAESVAATDEDAPEEADSSDDHDASDEDPGNAGNQAAATWSEAEPGDGRVARLVEVRPPRDADSD